MKRSKAGIHYSASGYRYIRLSTDEREAHTCAARSRKYIAEHRQIVERVLGRCLKVDEAVHHINGNKLDNRNQNLLVCSYSYHQYLHAEMARRWMLERFGHGTV